MIALEPQESDDTQTVEVASKTYGQLHEIVATTGESVHQVLSRLTEQAFLLVQEQKKKIILRSQRKEPLYVLCISPYKVSSTIALSSFCPNCFRLFVKVREICPKFHTLSKVEVMWNV